jgi:ribulose-phosphate 3-epimerase
MKEVKVSPSILSCDFSRLAEEIKKAEQAGSAAFHLDIMDGHFVPNISFGQPVVAQVRALTKLPLNAHLMIDHPWLYIKDFVDAGADIITLHIEAYDINPPSAEEVVTTPRVATKIKVPELKRDLSAIRSWGRQAGLALNPATAISLLDVFLGEIDLILVMSVNPGFSGQKFMPEVLPKIRSIRTKFSGEIEVDGGINAQTAPEVIAAGANILVSASYFFGADDYVKARQQLLG